MYRCLISWIDSMENKYLLDFRRFEFVHGVFKIPQNVYVFRSEKIGTPVNFTQPMFFGTFDVAQNYMSADRTLCAYEPKKMITLLDLRYVQAILPKLFQSVSLTPSDIHVIHIVSLAFGLVSFSKQIEIIEQFRQNTPALQERIDRMRQFAALPTKPSWVNPIEMQGVRCSVTEIDYFVAPFLKELFGGIADGIIAPALPTPFIGKDDVRTSEFLEEIILFNPESALQQVRGTNHLTHHGNYSLQTYILNLMPMNITDPQRPSRIYLQNGGSTNIPERVPTDWMLEKIADGDVKLQKELEQFTKKAHKLAEKLKKSQVYLRYYCPNICIFATPIPGTVRLGPQSS